VSAAGVAIRQATIDDAGEVAAVHVATWRGAYRGLMPQSLLDGLSIEARTEVWRRILRDDEGSTLVAIEQTAERLVGFVSVGASRDTDADRALSELYGLYLHPSYWGSGVGKDLHDSGLSQLPAGVEATLWVLDSNVRARKFYERQGWKFDGATKEDDRGEVILSEVRYRHR